MSAAGRRPERWSVEAGQRDVARLEIPADAQHERRFEISVRLRVRNRAGRVDAHHALRIQLDGALEWSRAGPTPTSGDEDGFEWRSSRHLPAGRALRIVATCELQAAERLGLSILAEELG